MSTDRAARWLVAGRVQGVGFRWFVQRRAAGLGLVGWATNLQDGRVEVTARGAAPMLDALDQALRVGPGSARVDNVERTDLPHEEIDVKSFHIK